MWRDHPFSQRNKTTGWVVGGGGWRRQERMGDGGLDKIWKRMSRQYREVYSQNRWVRTPLSAMHIETSPFICSANQWTSFYMIGISVITELSNCFDLFLTLTLTFPIKLCPVYDCMEIFQQLDGWLALQYRWLALLHR